MADQAASRGVPDTDAEAAPRVSVIITTFERAELVGRAIDSALDQTYEDLEVVVVDDGSTDGTDDVLEGYRQRDSRVRVVHHDTNQGVAAAKNTGVEAASGDLSLILDSDDELRPHALETMVGKLEDLGPEYGMVFARSVDGETGEPAGGGISKSGEITYEDAICGRFSGEFVGLWRSKLAEGLRFDEAIAGGEDLVWFQMYRASRVYYMHTPLEQYYRDAPEAITRGAGSREKHRGLARWKRRFIEEFGDDIEQSCPAKLADHYRALALFQALSGDRVGTVRSALRALQHRRSAMHVALLAMPLMPRRLLVALLERRADASYAEE